MIENIEQLRAVVPSAFGDDFELYRSSINDSINWIATQVVGPDIFAVLSSDARLQSLVDSVVAFRACGDVTPKLDVFHNGSGFVVANDDRYAPASRERVRALIESLNSSMQESLTLVYEHIEDSSELMTKFKGFRNCSVVEGSPLPSLREFRRFRPFEGGYIRWIEERFRHNEILVGLLYPRFSEQFISGLISETHSSVLAPLKYAFAAAFVGDMTVFDSFCDVVASELRRNASAYPSCPIVKIESYSSKSVISML